MGKEEEEVKRLKESYQKIKNNEKKYSFSVPHKLRTPVIWILFFSIVGIIQKSIAEGRFVFVDFFGKYYIEWFSSFGNFAGRYVAESITDVLYMMLKDWYYFFLTGGVISFIWALIYVLVNIRLEGEKDDLSLYIDNKLSR